jgi:MOSC domain-containing protein YiiM
MRENPVPPDRSAASLAACVASILEVTTEEVLATDEPAGWLAARGLGLVPVADPVAFEWPGPFIARGRDGGHVVAFGAPPGVLWDPSGAVGAAGDLEIEAAWVIAPLDPAEPREPRPYAGSGSVEAIVIVPAAEAPGEEVATAEAVAGRGLLGDRYADRTGTFSVRPGTGRDLTLIESEALRAALLPDGHPLSPAAARRNVVTRGIELDALIGRRFHIGEVRCIGRRRCEPCRHLERLTRPGALKALVHRGGLRADVVSGGTIAVGDVVGELQDESPEA